MKIPNSEVGSEWMVVCFHRVKFQCCFETFTDLF